MIAISKLCNGRPLTVIVAQSLQSRLPFLGLLVQLERLSHSQINKHIFRPPWDNEAWHCAIERLDPGPLSRLCKSESALHLVHITNDSQQVSYPPIIFKHSSATYLHTMPDSTFNSAVVPPSNLAPSTSLKFSNS